MSPVFAHGQLRLYLLALLDQGPRHGYEVIRDLEDRFGGLYSPSAGTIYPRLAKLEEEGLVRRTDEGRKSPYTLTDLGRAQVRARAEAVQDLEQDLDRSVHQLAADVRARVKETNADLRSELRTAAREARRSATPVSGNLDREHPARQGSWNEIEQAVHQLRRLARAGDKRAWKDPQVQQEVLAVVRDAAARVEQILGR